MQKQTLKLNGEGMKNEEEEVLKTEIQNCKKNKIEDRWEKVKNRNC